MAESPAKEEPGTWIETGDVLTCRLQRFDRHAERLGNLRQSIAAEIVNVLSHDALLQRVLLRITPQLEQEALLQITAPDPGRVEILDHHESAFEKRLPRRGIE